MKKLLKILNDIFIDGLSGMATGLFCTLIIGTILEQIGKVLPGVVGNVTIMVGRTAMCLTGAGIGCGVAVKLKKSPLVTLSAAVSGMVGAFATKMLDGNFYTGSGTVTISGVGEPLGAFVAAYIAIVFGSLVASKTKVDILITPLVAITCGSLAGLFIGTPIARFMSEIGQMINWGTEQHPIVMGVVVAVLMGMALTLPISSAAIGVSLGLSGIAAGAAVVGCCANMVGFAVSSYRENKMGGLIAQGIGTSMLQIPNIVKKPIIWLPAILTSTILGPISSAVLKMTCNATGAGMGSAGFVGQIMTFNTMTKTTDMWLVILEIVVMHFVAPALLSLAISEGMRKMGMIKKGDMKLDV